MKETGEIRKAVVSGQFYPDDPQVLENQIKDFLAQVKAPPDPDIRALIVPHAGYDYSGQVAARAYRLVQGLPFESVILIAFLHRIFLEGVLVDEAKSYETPLGRVPVHQELVARIRSFNSLLSQKLKGRIEEHSLEVQLPFLQTVLPGAKIVPIYFGMQDFTNATILADALAAVIQDPSVLVVATTDLSHFYPYDAAVKKDSSMIALFEKGDAERIYEACLRQEMEACGIGPVLASILLGQKLGWVGPKLIYYANSGDITGSHDSVVGYAAMKFMKGNN